MKISIITINLDNKDGLKKTIESVINQTVYDKVEYIIIDGGSTDGSIDVIKENLDNFSFWVSEKDNGIYNAMNKGIKVSTGDYLLFLNSGDYLKENNVLEKALPYLEYDVVYGNEWKVNERYKGPYEAKYPDKLDEGFFRRTSLPHQSTFIRAELFKENPYSETFKIISDWKFFIEAFRGGKTYKHMPFIVSVYDCSGFSCQHLDLMQKEKNIFYKS